MLPFGTYAKLALAVVDAVKWIAQQLHDQKMITEGERRAVEKGMDKANVKVQEALAARVAADNADPGKLHDTDGHKRSE